MGSVVAAPLKWIRNRMEEIAGPSDRPQVLRTLDPFDLAGHASRSVMPSHPTPAVAHAVYYVALAGLVAAEVVEAPVALLLAGGHLLLQSHNAYAREFGDALEDGA